MKVRVLIKNAPKEVIVAIFSAAFNGHQGDGHIPTQLIPLVQRHKHNVDHVVNRRKSIPFKRNLIHQKGGAIHIIVQQLATVRGSPGGKFMSRDVRNNDQ